MEAQMGRTAALRVLRPLTKWEVRPAEAAMAERTRVVRTMAMEVSPSPSLRPARSIRASASVPPELRRPVAEGVERPELRRHVPEGSARPGAGRKEPPACAEVSS